MHARIPWAALALAALAACSSDDDDGGAAANCDPAPNVGQAIQESSMAGPPPAMTGGAIADGTYALTSDVYYNGHSGSHTRKHTLYFAGGTVKAVESVDGMADTIIGGAVSTSGSTLTYDVVCPTSGSISTSFTATATAFTQVSPNDPDHVQIWTRQ